MELWRLWVLRGPNIWSARPVIEVGIDAEASIDRIALIAARIAEWCAPGVVTDGEASLAELVSRLTLHLQALVGNPVSFRETRSMPLAGRFRFAVEYREESVGEACVRTAFEMCRVASVGELFPIDAELVRLRDLADAQILGPSSFAVAEAARLRGIPVDFLNPEDGRYLQLGQGAKQRRSLASETDDISAVARSITTDKHLTKVLLRAAGVPVPEGRPVVDADDAWKAALELGGPVAVKPQDRDLAQGIGLDLRTREQVVTAYMVAHEKSPYILVERFAPGVEHRVLVVDGKVIAVARIDPPHVVGDGRSTVRELAEAINRDPRRGDDYRTPLRRLKLDAVADEVLASQGQSLDTVPNFGAVVLLRRNPPYIKNGGCLLDLTDVIHPRVAEAAVDAARCLGLRVAGLDVVAVDIRRPLEEQMGVVVEVNAGPGLWLHMAPWAERPRPVGEAIVATMFAAGEDGRIPVIAVTGGDARMEAGKQIAGLLGPGVGRASAEGVFVSGRRVLPPGVGAREGARAVLQNTSSTTAVLEVSAGELLQQGLGCDRCDVAVVTNAFEEAESDAWKALVHALSGVGTLILNADDPPEDRSGLKDERIVWLSRFGPPGGRRSVFVRDGAIVVNWDGREESMPLRADEEAGSGQLAAVAVGMTMGQGIDQIFRKMVD